MHYSDTILEIGDSYDRVVGTTVYHMVELIQPNLALPINDGLHLQGSVYYKALDKEYENVVGVVRYEKGKERYYYHLKRNGRYQLSDDHPALGDVVYLYGNCNDLFDRTEKINNLLNE